MKQSPIESRTHERDISVNPELKGFKHLKILFDEEKNEAEAVLGKLEDFKFRFASLKQCYEMGIWRDSYRIGFFRLSNGYLHGETYDFFPDKETPETIREHIVKITRQNNDLYDALLFRMYFSPACKPGKETEETFKEYQHECSLMTKKLFDTPQEFEEFLLNLIQKVPHEH